MKIWIFNHYANGPNSVGITRHYDLAKKLAKKGHQITIFTSSFNHWSKSETVQFKKNQFFKIEYYDGIRFIWIKTKKYNGNNIKRIENIISYYFNSKKALMYIKETPSVVIGSIMHPLAAVLALKSSRIHKVDFIFEERDLWPQTLVDLGKLKPKNPIVIFLYMFEKFMYTKAKKIIVLFDKAPDYVMLRGIKKEKIIYLPNGVDLERYLEIETLPDYLEEEFDKLSEKFIVVYAGAHGFPNNLDRLIELANLTRENIQIHYLLFGDGTEKKRLIDRTKSMGLMNITFMDPIKKEFIPSVLKRCNLGFLSIIDSPLYKWGFSMNKIYDYLAASLPILLDTTIKNTFISEFELGYSSNDLINLSNKIKEYSKTDITALKDKAVEYVKEHHNWDLLADKLEFYLLETDLNIIEKKSN